MACLYVPFCWRLVVVVFFGQRDRSLQKSLSSNKENSIHWPFTWSGLASSSRAARQMVSAAENNNKCIIAVRDKTDGGTGSGDGRFPPYFLYIANYCPSSSGEST